MNTAVHQVNRRWGRDSGFRGMPEEQPIITLGLLNAIEENEQITQRAVAKDLGVALGMVNAYLKRCVKKGYVKVTQAPANRYAYYLTPTGFSEKGRLTAEYLFSSFNFFRNARQECSNILMQCVADGYHNIVLVGSGDLAEIFVLCSREFDVHLNGLVEDNNEIPGISGLPRFANICDAGEGDAFIITSLSDPQKVYSEISKIHDNGKIYIPGILGVSRNAPNMDWGPGK